MTCSLRNVDACLPITAIQALDHPDARVILNGQGPHVRLLDDNSGLLLANIRAFERNNVHGILIKNQVFEEDRKLRAELLIWGGQSFREATVTVWKTHASVEASFDISGHEYEAPDWILDGAICFDDQTLGSPKACLITAHNALLILDFKPDSCQPGHGTIEWRELATGLRSILYSADVTWISPEHILVAAGTVFGEIVVWSCYLKDDSPKLSTENSLSVHYYFTGHEGSIFGVNISPEVSIANENNPRRFLASCSDDRTIRIWDISDCFQSVGKSSVHYATDGFGLHATGFGETPSENFEMNSKSCIAKAWGHASRIWGVYFLESSCPENTASLRLISRGEDSTCQLWRLDFQSGDTTTQEAKLNHISSYCYHSGKNIWSLAICRDLGCFKIYAGGADGCLVPFCIQDDVKNGSSYGVQTDSRDMNSMFFHDTADDGIGGVEPSLALINKPKKKTKKEGDAAKCYNFVADDYFLTVSVQGDVRLGHISNTSAKSELNGSTGSKSPISFEKIPSSVPIGKCPITASLPRKGIAVVCGNNRDLQWYDKIGKNMSPVMAMGAGISNLYLVDLDPSESNEPASGLSGSFAILVSYFNLPEVDILLNQRPDLELPVLSSKRLVLPEIFRATSFLYIKEPSCVILGSRNGALAVYRLSEDLDDKPPIPSVFRSIHGEETVTSIIRIQQPNNPYPHREVIVSCGRDGTYAVHFLDLGLNIASPVSLETVHQSSPPFGPNIEGAHFNELTNDLILHGFRHRDFIVWNESAQTEILSAECGGSNRLWAFTPRLNAGGAGTFIWTQASTFNMFSMESPSHRVLRVGGHGREIKALSISNNVACAQGSGSRLLATGAEDTTIRIFDIENSNASSQWGSFKCLRTLKKHSGGLQNLRWSPRGNFLFSSSGCEEFFVWRVRSVPRFGIGLVFEASCPKSKVVSDLRIINFDLLEVDGPERTDCFLLGLAYSNSTVNVFHYSSSRSASKFTLLANGVYKTNCLTQIQFVKSGHHLSLITCATDGHATTWDLTEALGPFYSITEGNLQPQPPLLDIEAISPVEISWQHHHQIHQSSIKSMEIAHQSEAEAVLIGGGDDNALSISRIHIGPSPSPTKSRCSTLLIPKAHASAINAITILPQRSSSALRTQATTFDFTIASSGNDQRLKLWSVSVDLRQPGVDGIEVLSKADEFNAVADISCIDSFSEGDGDAKKENILVCGVGMDLWSVNGE